MKMHRGAGPLCRVFPLSIAISVILAGLIPGVAMAQRKGFSPSMEEARFSTLFEADVFGPLNPHGALGSLNLQEPEMQEMGNSPDEDSPRYSAFAALYLWLPMMDGDVTARGVSSDVNLAFSDVIDLLSELEAGLMGHVEVQSGDFSFFFDGVYLRLADESKISSGEIEVEIEETILELGAGYGLGEVDLGTTEHPHPVYFEVIGGVRWVELELDVDVQLGPASRDGDAGYDWFDPFVGMRVQAPLADSLSLSLRGDVGGFGIGTASDLSWQLAATLHYDISSSLFVSLGYRALDIDYDRGSGANKFEYDLLTHGPLLGLAYRF